MSWETMKSVDFQRTCSLRRVLIVRATTSIVWMMDVANPMEAMASIPECSGIGNHRMVSRDPVMQPRSKQHKKGAS